MEASQNFILTLATTQDIVLAMCFSWSIFFNLRCYGYGYCPVVLNVNKCRRTLMLSDASNLLNYQSMDHISGRAIL